MSDVVVVYRCVGELGRMTAECNGVEWRRSCELLARWVPALQGLVADIGGDPGEHAIWLQGNGFEALLVDVKPLHVDVARQRERFKLRWPMPAGSIPCLTTPLRRSC